MKSKPKFSEILSKSRAVNYLSAARFFLFGARDVWFVVALPVFLSSALGWDFREVGAFMASWIIVYGIIQSQAPKLTGKQHNQVPGRSAVVSWGLALCVVPALIAMALMLELSAGMTLIVGLFIFGALFAINSSLHSYLIVSFARGEGVSLDVGFYYMANAMGRLVGTLLSGWLFQTSGLIACLWVSAAFILIAALIALALPLPDADASDLCR